MITEEDEPASDSKEMSVETDDTSPGTETNAKNDEDSVQLFKLFLRTTIIVRILMILLYSSKTENTKL